VHPLVLPLDVARFVQSRLEFEPLGLALPLLLLLELGFLLDPADAEGAALVRLQFLFLQQFESATLESEGYKCEHIFLVVHVEVPVGIFILYLLAGCSTLSELVVCIGDGSVVVDIHDFLVD